VRRVDALDCMIAGSRIAARKAIILTLTSNSSKVKPGRRFARTRRMSDPGRYAQADIAADSSRTGGEAQLMGKVHWASDWKVGVRVWVEREGQAMLGEGRAELLAAIDTEHSITKAAKAAGMSYRRAWNLIQEVNEAAGELLVEAAVGGKQGGGARLTPNGKLALEVYDKVRRSLVDSAAEALRQAIAPDHRGQKYIHLAAAISMQEAVGQILAEYTLLQPSVQVRAIFGASNELADHLLAGAPGDIFISAE